MYFLFPLFKSFCHYHFFGMFILNINASEDGQPYPALTSRANQCLMVWNTLIAFHKLDMSRDMEHTSRLLQNYSLVPDVGGTHASHCSNKTVHVCLDAAWKGGANREPCLWATLCSLNSHASNNTHVVCINVAVKMLEPSSRSHENLSCWMPTPSVM